MSAAEKWLRARPTDGPDVTWFRSVDVDSDSEWPAFQVPSQPLNVADLTRILGNPLDD